MSFMYNKISYCCISILSLLSNLTSRDVAGAFAPPSSLPENTKGFWHQGASPILTVRRLSPHNYLESHFKEVIYPFYPQMFLILKWPCAVKSQLKSCTKLCHHASGARSYNKVSQISPFQDRVKKSLQCTRRTFSPTSSTQRML